MPVFAMQWLETEDLASRSLFVGGERQLVKRQLQLQSDELRYAHHCFIVILFSYEPKNSFSQTLARSSILAMPDSPFTLPGSFFTLFQPLHALETDLCVL